jgi:hypothetical protein
LRDAVAENLSRFGDRATLEKPLPPARHENGNRPPMPTPFAAATPARVPACLPIARALAARARERAANDNGDAAQRSVPNDQVLRAALRHFAQHGLGAARAAREQAERAISQGDRQAYDWWLGITRTLDRRMADAVSRLV